MIARILSPEEWQKVEDLDISQLLPMVRPEDIQVIVVEAEGRIVASMSLLRMTHLEGTWVHPDHRNAGVVRALLRKASEASAKWTDTFVVTAAATEEVRAILGRMHAKKLEMDSYVLSMKGN